MASKKRILIVSYFFTPNGEVGAIRPSKIADFLSEDGYQVDVFTKGYSSNDGGLLNRQDINVYRINNIVSNTTFGISEKPVKSKCDASKNLFLYMLKQHYRCYLDLKRDRLFFRKFVKFAKAKDLSKYDVIFTTANPISTILSGIYVKKAFPQIKWLNDFRDPIVDKSSPILFRPFLKSLQTYSCKKCDIIIAVSNGYLKRICGNKKELLLKAKLIPNGYDVRDLDDILEEKEPKIQSKLCFVYVGSLYEGKRNLSPLFKALSELAKQGSITLDNIEIKYAGGDFGYLLSQAEQYGMESVLINCGKVSHSECIRIQHESSILLLSTWNMVGEEGVFPGKFLEYMLIQKPIIGFVNGGLSNSEVSSVINEGMLGTYYEDADPENGEARIKDYITKCYESIMEYGTIDFEPKQIIVERYDYRNLISRLEEVIDA